MIYMTSVKAVKATPSTNFETVARGDCQVIAVGRVCKTVFLLAFGLSASAHIEVRFWRPELPRSSSG